MRLQRIREMSRDEIVYRIRETLRREADRVKFRLGIGIEQDREFCRLLESRQFSFKSYLMDSVAPRFYAGARPANQDKVIQLIKREFPNRVPMAVEEAEQLLNRRINVLGFPPIDLGKSIDWHTDPTSKYRWQSRFWCDLDVMNAPSDPKIIHELNRHQHLPRLAKAFFITGDERYAAGAVAQLESWIDQNRAWEGVNWQSSLELAIRTISWLWTLMLLLPSNSLDERATRRISKSLFAQMDHIYRYPSLYSSPNTHLIGEAAALFMAGILFPELPRANRWRRFAAAVLVDEMERQVSEEGVYREASTYYHCYATDFYLQTLILARINQFIFPQWMWRRVSQMLEYVMHLTRSDGSIPLIGDDDGGRVLALANQHYRNFRDGLSTGAVVFGRPEFKFVSKRFAEESLWMLGTDAWTIFNAMSFQQPSNTRRAYPKAGHFIQRSGWGKSDCHVVFDCGGLGMLSGGHGHADALSLTLFSGGRKILIDPGTAVYNGAHEWRNFFRSTRSHNTVVVDDTNQSDPGGTFNWKTRFQTKLIQHITLTRPTIEYVDAEHDGYTRLCQPITHRRRLVNIHDRYWLVLDELRGRGTHKYEFLYHFAPEAQLLVYGDEVRGEVDCRARLKQAGLQLFMYGSAPVYTEVQCGQMRPLQGWSSERYGQRKPNPVLCATMQEQAPAGMLTLLLPGTENECSRRLNARGGRSIAAVIREGEYEDVIVQSLGNSLLHLMECALQGEFFWIRTQNGAVVQVLAINGRRLELGDHVVFENDEPLPYVMAHVWENGIVIERGEREGRVRVYVRDLRDRQFQRR